MEAQLLIYDDLAADDRRVADDYLQQHPEAWAIVEHGRQLQRFFREASRERPQDGSELMAGDEDRVDEIIAQLPPAREHLSALLDEAHERHFSPRRSERAPARPPVRRGARARRSAPRAWIVVLAAAVVFVVLFIASATSLPTNERLAALPSLPHTVPGLTLRSDDIDVDQVSQSYLEALTLIHDARSTTLGLFPTYDVQQLDAAINQLSETARMDAGGTIGLEAVFVRGRLHLHLGEVDEAVRDLTVVVDQSGPSASDARRLLGEIDSRL